MNNAEALMSLDDRVLHAPSQRYGKARCGLVMREPWLVGEFDTIADRALGWCDHCYQLTAGP